MKLYVGNLPYQASEVDLENWFSQAGVTVDSVALIRDRFSGEPRGFGFVEIHNHDAAVAALATCNGKTFMGRTVVVNEARPMTPLGRSGGERRGSGGGSRKGGRRTPRW
ncbi:MAG: RNA-binding protein [Bryobacterales bacterium]|nr:RNA-binding protein [Bryobacterales bacterium]